MYVTNVSIKQIIYFLEKSKVNVFKSPNNRYFVCHLKPDILADNDYWRLWLSTTGNLYQTTIEPKLATILKPAKLRGNFKRMANYERRSPLRSKW